MKTTFYCQSGLMFLMILQWYYWYLVQMCLILYCKFVYAAARVLSYFSFLWCWFFTFSVCFWIFNCFRSCQAIFVFLRFRAPTSSLFDNDNFGTNFFAFYFAISNLSSYFWCLMQTYLIFKVKLVYFRTKITMFSGSWLWYLYGIYL